MFDIVSRLHFALIVALALLCGLLAAGCGESKRRSVSVGTYVGQLCNAVGPFEVDAQAFGHVLAKSTLRLTSRKSKEEVVKILEARNGDSLRIVRALEMMGPPDIAGGQKFATETVGLFKHIAKSDLIWRYELLGPLGPWVWPDPSASPSKRNRLLISVGALGRVGRQFERLLHTREGEEAIARNGGCKSLFDGERAFRGTANS